jgi:hypothetical protein
VHGVGHVGWFTRGRYGRSTSLHNNAFRYCSKSADETGARSRLLVYICHDWLGDPSAPVLLPFITKSRLRRRPEVTVPAGQALLVSILGE